MTLRVLKSEMLFLTRLASIDLDFISNVWPIEILLNIIFDIIRLISTKMKLLNGNCKKVWRRAYDIPPPPMDLDNADLPANDPKYSVILFKDISN